MIRFFSAVKEKIGIHIKAVLHSQSTIGTVGSLQDDNNPLFSKIKEK